MACLPPLTQLADVHLPLSEASAAALVRAMVGADLRAAQSAGENASDAAAGELLAALALDPFLALWTAVHHSGEHPAAQCVPTPAQLAGWLAGRVAPLFAKCAGEPAIDLPSPAALADVAARSVTRALRAETLAGTLDAAAQRAYLAGLLGEMPAWLASRGDAARSHVAWPGWLPRVWAEVPAAQGQAESCEADANGASDATAQLATRAEMARQRWLVPPGVACGLLHPLAGKLARLDALERAFQETLEAEKLEALAEFAAGAGHEINNPLAVISGRAQLFLRREQRPELRRELAVINTQAKRVYEMIADLMLFARPPAVRAAACDVSQLIERLISELADETLERGAHLRRTDVPTPLVIEADATQLHQALRAVCENALAACPAGGVVTISAQRAPSPPARDDVTIPSGDGCRGDGLEITIADHGPGIPDDVRRHLFDPFYSGRGAGRGLGLGLSKCWRIVTNHGGTIRVESAEGAGSTFTIRLPVEQSTDRG